MTDAHACEYVVDLTNHSNRLRLESAVPGRPMKVVVRDPAHPDGPAIVAEVLDRIAVYGQDLKAAAEALGCSSSQLVKLLKIEPRALAMVNQARVAKGLRAYL